MSYRRALGFAAPFTSTSWFAEGVDPYAARLSPRGSIYSPYGWGPDMMIGMPMNYTHHIDYVQDPVLARPSRIVRNDIANAHRRIPGARANIGPMRDVVGIGNYDHGQYEGDMQSLGGQRR
jgi:hypothetical protein